MCKFASMVLTKDRVFWSKKTDSHDQIIREFGLHEGTGPTPNTLKIEMVPIGDDPFSDPATWEYRVDQDRMPEWFDANADEARAREALGAIVEARVFVGKSDLVFSAGEIVFVKDSSRTVLHGSSRAVLQDSSSAVLQDYSSAVLHGSSRAELYGSSSAELHGSSSAVLHGSSRAELYGSSSAVLHGSSRAVLHGSSRAVLQDSSSAVLHGSSRAVLQGSSRAESVKDYATVRHYSTTDPCSPTGPHAVVIDSRGDKSKCVVGKGA